MPPSAPVTEEAVFTAEQRLRVHTADGLDPMPLSSFGALVTAAQ